MLDDLFHKRLLAARLGAGYASAADAAKHFRWNENTYKSHENGIRKPRDRATVQTYAEAFGVNFIWLYFGTGEPAAGAKPTSSAHPGTREEGVSYNAAGAPFHPHKALIEQLLRDRPNACAKIMKTEVLALQGIRPGDVMIFDRSVEARKGDIVCAQIIEGDSARTVFRLYQPPNLIAAGFDPAAIRPEIVDDERVSVAGVMTDLLRRRASHD